MRKTGRILVALVTVLALGLTVAGCSTPAPAASDSNSVVGSWVNNDLGMPFTLTLNADGTGKYDMGGMQTLNLTYKIDGNKIAITFEGDSAPTMSDFTLTGNTLSMKDMTGADVTYKKV